MLCIKSYFYIRQLLKIQKLFYVKSLQTMRSQPLPNHEILVHVIKPLKLVDHYQTVMWIFPAVFSYKNFYINHD